MNANTTDENAMKLERGGVVQELKDAIPPGRAVLGIAASSCDKEWLECQRVSVIDLLETTRTEAGMLYACPTIWAGVDGDTQVLVFPRPDKPYSVAWL